MVTSDEPVPSEDTAVTQPVDAPQPLPSAASMTPVPSEPAEAAYRTMPYRGARVSLRHLAGDAGISNTTQAKPAKPVARAAGTEIKAKNLKATVVTVPGDRRTLTRLSPVQREAYYRDQEALRIGAKREVRCGSGWCDLLSSSEIVEVKEGRHWRHALGQALAYSTYWPDRRRRIHLFDIDNAVHLAECVRVCAAFDVVVSVAQVRQRMDGQ
ncbi:hypothetical protein [Azospirillum thiophilum]|uniref:hypothetical protein n=1 Tax=Azospirillum thiophilum TaxID=528244 RepID=UPI000698507B|nr:hypothetical protein [Azospirillum thiophilum]